MPSNSDLKSNNDVGTYILFLLVLPLVTYFGFLYVWDMIDQDIKFFMIHCAYYLHFIQKPFTFLFSDAYAGAVNNMPSIFDQYKRVDYDDSLLKAFSTIATRSVSILLAIPLLTRGFLLFKHADKYGFTRNIGWDELITIGQQYYPRILPATRRNLLLESSRFGGWAKQLNPIDLGLYRGLLSLTKPEDIHAKYTNDMTIEAKEEENKRVGILKDTLNDRYELLKVTQTQPLDHYASILPPLNFRYQDDVPTPLFTLPPFDNEIDTLFDKSENYLGMLSVNVHALKDYFIKSLGSQCRYSGNFIDINKLPPIERSLWVLFLAMLTRKPDIRKRIEAILDNMAKSFIEDMSGHGDHQISLEDVNTLYHDIKNNQHVKKCMLKLTRGHAYYTTAFTALYMAANESYGTISTPEFRWLKPVNRQLFWILNQVGLDKTRYETAAIRSHYYAEFACKKAIRTPYISSPMIEFCHTLAEEGWLTEPITELNDDTESEVYMRAQWLNNSPPF